MLLRIKHTTTYRYANPVTLGPHKLMFRPRDSHDLRLLETSLSISPAGARVRWLHDVFGNSVAIVEFKESASELSFVSEILLEQFTSELPPFALEEFARTYPFSYSAEETPDLGRTSERHYTDPDHQLDKWAKQFAVAGADGGLIETLPLLERMTLAIKHNFTYMARDAEGTQTPIETLSLGSGSCRDYSLLMMEACRSLGLAARFVSGYLYDPITDNPNSTAVQSTHAWVQIYLPGAGWTEYDPTNGFVGSKNLIRVAVTRDPSQAVPVAGQWTGNPADYQGMSVAVSVTSENNNGR